MPDTSSQSLLSLHWVYAPEIIPSPGVPREYAPKPHRYRGKCRPLRKGKYLTSQKECVNLVRISCTPRGSLSRMWSTQDIFACVSWRDSVESVIIADAGCPPFGGPHQTGTKRYSGSLIHSNGRGDPPTGERYRQPNIARVV